MTITVRCPDCQKRFSTSESSEGRTATCPACGEAFTVRREIAATRPAVDLVELANEEAEEEVARVASQPVVRRRVAGGKFCSTCGEPIHVRAELCSHCGVRQAGPTAATHNRFVAFLLAFFGGMFGFHKFYTNKAGLGVVYLLCGTVGWLFVLPVLIIALISLIESFLYLSCGSDEEFTATHVAK